MFIPVPTAAPRTAEVTIFLLFKTTAFQSGMPQKQLCGY